MAITQDIVDIELDVSVELDGPIDLSQKAEQICIDLGTYSLECEGVEVDVLLPFVRNWLERRRQFRENAPRSVDELSRAGSFNLRALANELGIFDIEKGKGKK